MKADLNNIWKFKLTTAFKNEREIIDQKDNSTKTYTVKNQKIENQSIISDGGELQKKDTQMTNFYFERELPN